MALSEAPKIDRVSVRSYRVPTESPESDGTLAWEATTVVVVELNAGGEAGLGYTYADTATAVLIRDKLLPLIEGADATAVPAMARQLLDVLRNSGQMGVAAMAVSAVDNALWDLKAKLLGVSVVGLLGSARDSIPAYASGGFTSWSEARLQRYVQQQCEAGYRFVKIKVGREPDQDLARVRAARAVMSPEVELFVDANGAYTVKQALAMAEAFQEFGVAWFEEPVSSQDLEGLNAVRAQGPAGIHVSAGEYGYDPVYFRRMLQAQAVDVLQADATRCLGISGFMQADAISGAFNVPLSSHCAPALHAHACCAARSACHLEHFYDHVRIEGILFDGAPPLRDGALFPAPDRPGFGLTFKQADAEAFAV